MSAVADIYALALLDLTVANGTLQAVREQLDQLASLLQTSRELNVAFSNPTLTMAERERVVDALAQRLSLSKTTRSFLMVLASKGRLPAVQDIATAFGRLADERTGVLRARCVSSVPLSVTQTTRLKAMLSELTGRTVMVSNDIDPSLLGGVRVHVAGKVYDTTVATQLQQLRGAILNSL
ncbi:MAG: ATP synthase F1 subunit delta [Myxococcales bacterium]|nr:ATP synthase F1 subunit delta [Myxococcales bacterium]MCB9532048.1 ATP synthase F1 subunit delta [Myxococcales bacterium]